MTNADTPFPAVELRAGLPTKELHARLALSVRLRDVGQRALAFYLADMDRRALHRATGHATTAKFALLRLGLTERRAREYISVGRALLELPAVDAAFAEDRLGWSKVVLLASIATPDHEAAWLELALSSTCRDLAVAVQRGRKGSAPRAPGDRKGLPEVRFPVKARVDALTLRKLELAKEKLSAERGEPIDDATLLGILAELVLGSDDDGSLPGRQRVDASLYRIVIHAGATEDAPRELDAPHADRLHLDMRDGRMPLTGGQTCSLCDGECIPVDDATAKVVRDIATPPALRRRVLARDGHRCRCCRGKRGLMVHHIHHRSRGGRTKAANLITLCTGCHATVHADLLVLEGPDATRITFLDREGHPLEGQPPTPSGAPTLTLDPPEVAAARTHGEASSAPSGPARPEPVPFEEAFAGIVGQDERLERLRRMARAARARDRLFPHTLFCGPAGTGKTTFATALARHLGTQLVTTSGPEVCDVPALERLLARVPRGGMLFIDEIHAVPRETLEHLYEVMSGRVMSGQVMSEQVMSEQVMSGKGRLTLLAATTELGDLPPALRSRFGLVEGFDFHDAASLAAIATRTASDAGVTLDSEAALHLARCAAGTPRDVIRLTQRALDHRAALPTEAAPAQVGPAQVVPTNPGSPPVEPIRLPEAQEAMGVLGYDATGLDPLARRYLAVLRRQRGPVSLARIASLLGLTARTVFACIEPFLAHRGLVEVTARGRVATANGSGALALRAL